MTSAVDGKTVLVAGASGYLGRHVVRTLAANGARVRALVRPGREAPGAHECFEGQATDSASIGGACDGVDWVFSSLGITRQRDAGVSYADVDYGANVALLREAERALVKRFGVISVVDAERFRGNPMVDAKLRFLRELRESGVAGRVVCATGFFSDMKEFLEMGRKGTVYLFGDGRSRMNPIDASDLAEAIVDALGGEKEEVSVGGPDILSWDEVAALACKAFGRTTRRRRVPIGLMRAGLPAVRLFSRKAATTLDFILRVSQDDLIAPRVGERHLSDFYSEMAATDGTPSGT